MFREMRRGEKATDFTKTEELMKSQDFGILTVNGDDGYPYGVPVNYVYADGKIYLHSSSAKCHKLDAAKKNEKVGFTIVTEHDLIPEKLDTMYTSVVAFGKARVLTSEEDLKAALKILLLGLSPGLTGKSDKIYKAHEGQFVMVEITVEHISGKIGR